MEVLDWPSIEYHDVRLIVLLKTDYFLIYNNIFLAFIDVSIICRYGRVNTARCLLDSIQGSYVINDVNSEGKTPLHLASESGHVKVVALLMQRGALLHRYETPTNYLRFNSLTCSILKQPEKYCYASFLKYCMIVRL